MDTRVSNWVGEAIYMYKFFAPELVVVFLLEKIPLNNLPNKTSEKSWDILVHTKYMFSILIL